MLILYSLMWRGVKVLATTSFYLRLCHAETSSKTYSTLIQIYSIKVFYCFQVLDGRFSRVNTNN